MEEVLPKPRLLGLAEEARGDDAVGIDVRQVHGDRAGRQLGESFHDCLLAHEGPPVGDLAGDGGRRGHGGAHEMRTGALALAPLEVAVGSGSDALTLARGVAVHAYAHGAAWIAPLEARRREDLVEPFRLRGLLHETGAGNDPRLDHGAASLRDGGGGAQVLGRPVVAEAVDTRATGNSLGGVAGRRPMVAT